MTFEDNLAAALRTSADTIPVGAPPVEAVIQRGKAIRRRRQTARAALVGAALVPSVLAVVLSLARTEPDIPPAGPITTTPTSVVQVVEAGERIDVGRGATVWLTKDGQLVADVPSVTARHVPLPVMARHPSVPDASISVRKLGGTARTLYVGFYKGSGKLAKVTVQSGGVTLNAKVVTLAGNPGWAAFYVDGLMPIGVKGTQGIRPWGPSLVTVTGYAASGTTLAQLKDAPG